MNYDYKPTEMSRSIMAGLFAGLGSVLAILIFNFIYRDITGFSASGIINISSISFSVLIFFLIAGVIFEVFHHAFKKGTLIFEIVAAVATILTIIASLSVPGKLREGMVLGIVIISGIFLTIILPRLYSSNAI
ncbi:MAG: hypothetical protein JSR00_01225 [Bacteroidetes bacterium]|nr:hypothetical protein [Bacteroidota bacterium]